MSQSRDVHYTKEALLAFNEGRYSDADAQSLETHICECPVCAEQLARLDQPGGLPDQIRAAFQPFDAITASAEDTARDQKTQLSMSAWKPFFSESTVVGSLGRLGHYEILNLAGRGSFGTVFRAFDSVLERVVALKVLVPSHLELDATRRRFLHEAKAAASLRHDNIVQIYGVHESPLPYLVMEFIPGETLQERLNRQKSLSIPEVIHFGCQIAAGLAAAHSLGLVHRDIKPANILIETGDEERIKITDFGLALRTDSSALVQSHLVAGTPLYMSPEQVTGKSLDPRSDLFSFGSVLYTMLSGRPPFPGSTSLSVMKGISDDLPRPIREIVPAVPADLNQLISSMLAKHPDERIQSAREVGRVLRQCGPEKQTLSLPATIAAAPVLPTNPFIGSHSTATVVKTVEMIDPVLPIQMHRSWSVVRKIWVGLVAVCMCMVATIVISTNHSEFIIETDSPEIAVQIDAEDGIVVEDRKTGSSYKLRHGKNRLPNGDYLLTLKTPEGLELDTSHVTLKRFGSVIAKVRAKRMLPGPELAPAADINPLVSTPVPTTTITAESSIEPGNENEPGAKSEPGKKKFVLLFDADSSGVLVEPFPFRESVEITLEAYITLSNKNLPYDQMHREIIICPNGKLSWSDTRFRFYTFHKDLFVSVPDPLQRRIHVAGVNDGRERRIYVDGKLAGRIRDAGMIAPDGYERPQQLRIGNEFLGEIDAVRISSSARYHQDFVVPAELTSDGQTVALYQFDEGQGDTIHDSSGHNRHGTIDRARWLPGDGTVKPYVDITHPSFLRWIDETSSLSSEQQVQVVTEKLRHLNPEFTGTIDTRIDDGVVREVTLCIDHIAELAPLRAFPGLKILRLKSFVNCGNISDLSQLRGMKLDELACGSRPIHDLKPLQGMPLTGLDIGDTCVEDLTPLAGMPLTRLSCSSTPITNLAPLKGMSLNKLAVNRTQVQDLSVLAGMPLTELRFDQKPVKDLSVLPGLPLKKVVIDDFTKKDIEVLSKIESLEMINFIPASEFFKTPKRP